MGGEAGEGPEQINGSLPEQCSMGRGQEQGVGDSEGRGLTEEGTVLDSPAVSIEALLQRTGEGGLRGQGVVDGENGDAQLLGPALEVGLMGSGGLGHEATAMDVHHQGL